MKSVTKMIQLVILTASLILTQQYLYAQDINPINMNIKQINNENTPVQKQVLFTATQGKVISLQIAKGEQLKEHVSNLPAIFVCIIGDARYEDEKGTSVNLKTGDYVFIDENVKHKVIALEDSNFLLIK